MKKTIISILSAFLMIYFTCNSCKKNTLPIASISGDSTSFVGDSLLLDGSSSSDADNDSLSYCWSVIASPENAEDVLHIIDSASRLFIPDVGGSYTLQLIVNDGTIDSEPVSMNIDVLDYHGTWAMFSWTPPIPNAPEPLDTVVYKEDGTFEYYAYYIYKGELEVLYKGNGNFDTPARKKEWNEVAMAIPPSMELQTFTMDNDPYGTLDRMNTPTGDGKSVYILSDGGNTLTIKSDGNNDGDFDDVDTYSETSDAIVVWTRVEKR